MEDHRESHRESNMEVIRDNNVEDNNDSYGRSHEEHGMEGNRESDITEGRRKMKLTIGEHQVGQKLGKCMRIAYMDEYTG